MAFTRTKIRVFWGLIDLDLEQAKYPSYAGTDYVSGGDSAASGEGIGVRRVTMVLERSLASVADDSCEMHFDFLNTTSNEPDDTWTAGDFTTLETLLGTWWTAVKADVPPDTRLSRYLWNRVGTGVPKPNAAERIVDLTPVAGTGTRSLPPQCAAAISLRHSIRPSWGRTYLPIAGPVISTGRFSTTRADAIVAATVSLFNSARSADFAPVVVSERLSSAIGIEYVAMDDVIDIVRRRRWKHRGYLKATNLT